MLRRRKIVIMGSRSVGQSPLPCVLCTSWLNPVSPGKSSLVKQFIDNHFVEKYHPTMETEFQKVVNYKGIDFECEIVDTAGQVSPSLMMSDALDELTKLI